MKIITNKNNKKLVLGPVSFREIDPPLILEATVVAVGLLQVLAKMG